MEKVKIITVKKHVRLFKKKCVVCGKSFMGIEQARFCSASCRRRADYDKHREKRLQARREKYRRQKLASK